MTIKPMDDRILVEPLEEEKTTSGGIIIPDSAMGKVIAVGTDEDLQDKIKVGDKVLYAKYGGEEISVEGKEYKIIQRADVLAVVE